MVKLILYQKFSWRRITSKTHFNWLCSLRYVSALFHYSKGQLVSSTIGTDNISQLIFRHNRLKSSELLSNDRRSGGFISSQLGRAGREGV